MIIDNRTDIERRWLAMKNEMQSWVPGWRDCQRFIDPTRGAFEGLIPNSGRGIDHKTLLDNAPQRAVRTMAAGMTSGLTSPARPWFKIGLQDQELMEFKPIKEWLEIVEQRIYSIFSKANTYGVLNSNYEELGSFGTCSDFIGDDFESVIRMRPFTIGEYFLGQDANGRVNSFGRLFWKTAGQLVEEFGIDNVSPQVKNLFQRGQVDTWRRVCHLIEPNDERIPNKADYKNKAFRSIQWEQGSPTNLALRWGGFDEFPILAARWSTTTTAHIYGWGPGHKSLGDIKMLMMQKKDALVAFNKMVDPPVLKDGSVQGEANLLPGGVSTVSALTPNSGVRPAYQIQPDFTAIQAMIADTKQSIEKDFYSDLFLMLANSDSGQMTAYEVSKRYEEKLQQLGPVVERIKSELLDPLIERTFSLALKANVIPMPPREIQGQPMKIEYISMLAQAQKMVGTTAIEQTINFAIEMGTKGFPQVYDVIDPDDTIMEYADKLGVPPKMIRSKDELAQLREENAQRQQQEQMAAAMPEMAKGAKTLADAKLGQNSALDALTGNKTPAAAGANQ